MALLEIKNLTVNFSDKPVLKEVNLSLEQGKLLALLGESGAGKSLTAASIIRILPPAVNFSEQSKIIFQGKDLLVIPEIVMRKFRGKKIGLVFQEPATALNPVLTVGQQLIETLYQHLALKRRQAYARALELLHDVGFANPERIYNSYPHQLSGGMRQRVVIAIAIAAEPKLLIADEATSALDVTTQLQILNLLKKLQEKLDLAVLFITHDVNVAKKVADKIVVLHLGQVVEEASVEQFFKQPQNEYSKTLIAAASLPPRQEIESPHKNTPILETHDLCVHFPIQKGLLKRAVGWIKAVNNINLRVYPGQTLALVGESGCGKTTLARAILRLIEPTSGRIQFQNLDITKLNPKKMHRLRKDLQIIFQDPFFSLNPRMHVGEIISEGLTALKLVKSEAEREQRVDELLEAVNLPAESKYRYPHEFSGGQRQRIVIARALAVNPKFVICDEPTSALDVTTQKQIIGLLSNLQKELNLGYLFITHNIPLAASVASEIAVMRAGEIVEYGSVEQIMNHPQNDYTKELLAAVL